MNLDSLAAGWGAAIGRACWQGGMGILLIWTLCRTVRGMPASLRMWLWRLVYMKMMLVLLWAGSVSVPLLPPSVPKGAEASRPGLSRGKEAELRSVFVSDARPGAAREMPLGLTLVMGIWLIGVVGGTWRVGRKVLELRRLRARALPLNEEPAYACLAELCGSFGLQRVPALLETPGRSTPLVTGHLDPVIFLPAGLVSSCTPGELRVILGHEIAHLKRGDLVWCWLAISIRILLFFFPPVWLAEAEWRQAQEMACDEHVLATTGVTPREYGKALLNVAAWCRPLARGGPTTATVAESYRLLRRRLTAMRYVNASSRPTWARAGKGLFLLGWLALVPLQVTPRAMAAQEPGGNGALPMRGAEARPPRSYLVSCRFLASGREGAAVLSTPKLVVLERQWADVSIQTDRVEPPDVPLGEPLQAGDHVRLQVAPGKAVGEVVLDITVEQRGVEKQRRTGIRVHGRHLRAVERIKLGRVLKLDLEKSRTGPTLTRVEIVVTELRPR